MVGILAEREEQAIREENPVT